MPALNPLPRWQRRGLYGSVLALLLSGLGWLAVHYTIGAGTGELPHWSEPWWMRLHGAAAMASLLFFGSLLPTHAPRGWRMARQRRVGLLLWSVLGLLVGSGYALYYFAPDNLRPGIGWFHAALGTGLGLTIVFHRRGSRRGQPRNPHAHQAHQMHHHPHPADGKPRRHHIERRG